MRIVVAYQAGQGTDVVTRYLAEQLTKSLGQSFFVENRGGAGGNIGTEVAARAAADGYTLTMGTNATHALNQFLYATLPFNSEKDFEPIILVGTFPMAVLAGADSPITSIDDLVARVKANPRAADIALPSTTARLVYELLKERSQAPLFGVPYKGSSAAQSDVLGGQVPVMIDTVTAGRPLVASGKLRALGVTSAKPTALMPGAKTVAEQGLRGLRGHRLERAVCAQGHAAGDRQAAQRRGREAPRATRDAPAADRPRLRAGRRHARAARRLCARGARQVGAADQEGRHQGGVT